MARRDCGFRPHLVTTRVHRVPRPLITRNKNIIYLSNYMFFLIINF